MINISIGVYFLFIFILVLDIINGFVFFFLGFLLFFNIVLEVIIVNRLELRCNFKSVCYFWYKFRFLVLFWEVFGFKIKWKWIYYVVFWVRLVRFSSVLRRVCLGWGRRLRYFSFSFFCYFSSEGSFYVLFFFIRWSTYFFIE